MAIISGVMCDKCGRVKMRPCHEGKVFLTKWARAHGWKIGKFCTCPDCAKKKPDCAKTEE